MTWEEQLKLEKGIKDKVKASMMIPAENSKEVKK